jgi:UDP-N-acetyl-D-mannosaminuronic acid dehydrogenase
MAAFNHDVCVIGGGGHVGLPLAITLADVGLKTAIYDVNAATVESIRAGKMPFAEEGGQEMLTSALAGGDLVAHATPDIVADCEFLVLIVGTPVDEHLNPSFTAINRALEGCRDHLRDGQVLILRSTVFPGISRHVQTWLENRGLDIDVSFCPERVAQGYSLREFRVIPQIVSAFEDGALRRVKALFARFTSEFVEMSPMEAELCKLMTNAWRYLQFAAVNQFYMIATESGLDFDRILHGCRHHYPRMAGMPGPGLAAGPCLVKDTMQLAAFSQNNFVLGHAAMLVNEGLPAHLIRLGKREMASRGLDLSKCNAGILGMAFKAESDDGRDSLSYKLRKLLALEAKYVLATDPFVRDPTLSPMDVVLDRSHVLFVATPHAAYRELMVSADTVVIDIWNCVRHRRCRPEREQPNGHPYKLEKLIGNRRAPAGVPTAASTNGDAT